MLSPSDLARHYSRFRVTERVLLTGHSHQAWPDAGFEAQQQAWLDAAEYVDGKWERAAGRAAEVRHGFARLLGVGSGEIALGQNTHELVTRWLSALPLTVRPRVVTTDGEFHSLRRQMQRLAESVLDVHTVAARPVDGLPERLAAAIDDRTAAVLVSSVLYATAEIVPGLDRVAAACERRGAHLLVDAYHHLNVVPFDAAGLGLERAFVTGGGYKYCQLGEGNCFLRVPPGTRMRPVLTGWFAEFEALESSSAGTVGYGDGAAAFAGATYDPTSHYRAAAVFRFQAAHGMTADQLRAVSRRQTGLVAEGVQRLGLDPAVARLAPVAPERRAGFVAVNVRDAAAVARALRGRGIFVDARGGTVRIGPAPYVSDDQIEAAVLAFGEVLRAGTQDDRP